MVAATDHIGELVAPPASSGVVPDTTPVNSSEQQYRAGMDPYLAVVIGEGERLAELGQARSRNVLELGVRMDRFREASDELQAYVQQHPPPASLESTVGDLLTQLAAAETAIQASISAIRAFDWDSLGTSVADFSRAVDAIELIGTSQDA